MSKFRKILIAVLAVAMTVCVSVALAACDNNPGFINPGDSSNNYVIDLQSQGGLRLNDIKVTAMKDGEAKAQGITVNGRIEFNLDPDDYEFVIDESTLPAGYTPPTQTIKASAENKTVSVKLTSKVITETAPGTTRYKLGDVMYDFAITDVTTGTNYRLSNLLNNGARKAVMINFFGTACGPCMSEFDAINEAYNTYRNNIEILAIANYSIPDTESSLKDFKTKGEYGFPVSLDTSNIGTLFRMGETVNNITRGWPTTVIIDRYGVVAEISVGANPVAAEWRATFNKYTSDNYSQGELKPGEENSDNSIVYQPRPDGYEMPDDAAIKAAIGDGNGRITSYYYDFTAENEENTWPWQIGGEGNNKYLTASNANADESFAIINLDLKLSPLEGIAFDYNVNTFSERNSLSIVMDGKQYFKTTGYSEGWKTQKLMDFSNENQVYYSTSTRTVQLSFIYLKSGKVDEATPVSIRNIRVYNAAEESGIKDFAISVVDNKKPDSNGKYNLNITKSEDGFYYYNYIDASGANKQSLLMVNVNDITAWTDIHYGEPYFKSPEGAFGSLQPASLYYISYWFMSHKESIGDDSFTRLDYDPDDTIVFAFYLQMFSDNGYLPVTDKVKDKLIEFTKQAYNIKDEFKDDFRLKDNTWYEDQWYELCYYFQHFGANHAAGEKCWEKDNPVEGLSFDYAIPVEVGTTEVNVTKILNLWTFGHELEAGGGVKYKFTPDKSGVYRFYSTHERGSEADPKILIADHNREYILAENDNDPRYDRFQSFDAFLYVELIAGQTYYITAAMHTAAELGKFTMHIEYAGEYVEMIRIASTGNGFWTWYEDKNGNPITDADGNIIFFYLAQNAALNPDDLVYWVVRGTNYYTPMYIDFVHSTFFDDSGRSLKYLLENGAFSNRLNEGEIAELKAYYEKSVAGKDENDPMYGLCEAEARLVGLLSKILGELTTTNDWQQAACFIETYGKKAN